MVPYSNGHHFQWLFCCGLSDPSRCPSQSFRCYQVWRHPWSNFRVTSPHLMVQKSGVRKPVARWWFQIFFNVHPYSGKISSLTNMFRLGWFNHQLGVEVGSWNPMIYQVITYHGFYVIPGGWLGILNHQQYQMYQLVPSPFSSISGSIQACYTSADWGGSGFGFFLHNQNSLRMKF